MTSRYPRGRYVLTDKPTDPYFKEEPDIRHQGISFHDRAEVLDQILTEYPQLEAVEKVRTLFRAKNLVPCTACRYCTEGCPMSIAIPDLFACLNAKKAFQDWNSDYYYNNVHTVSNGKVSAYVKCGA